MPRRATPYVQPHSRDKHWDFFVSEFAVRPVVEPLVEQTYREDGDDLVEVLNREGYACEPIRRNEQRTNALADFIATSMSHGSVDFHHDPEHGEDPSVVRDDLRRALVGFFDGAYDSRAAYDPTYVLAQPLFNDDFAPPVEIKTFIAQVLDAIVAAIADGTIEVTADEPYDSCRGCGGYHNVNHDCGHDDDDDDDETLR